MDIDLQFRPSYSLAVVRLQANERIRADSGAMVSFSANLEIETKAEGASSSRSAALSWAASLFFRISGRPVPRAAK